MSNYPIRIRNRSYSHLPPGQNGQIIAYPAYYLTLIAGGGNPNVTTYTVWSSSGSNRSEQCIDFTHPRKFGHYDSGGSCDITRIERKAEPVPLNVHWHDSFWTVKGEGVVYPVFTVDATYLPSSSTVPPKSFGDISSYGATAWNKFKPGKPEVDLAVALAELKDFHSLFQIRLKNFKDLGNDYLNYQFGWLPFLSDVRRFWSLTQKLGQKLDELQRANGKWHLRRGTVKVDSAEYSRWETHDNSKPCFSPSLSSWLTSNPDYKASGRSYYDRKIWFSGRFRYHIPDLDKSVALWNVGTRVNVARKLYGLRITPATLWELMPWSWLIDWFSNAGDVISNISGGAVDCVAKYAYVMGTTSHTSVQHCEATLAYGAKISGVVSLEAVYKQRVAANPFGFGLTDSQLSARQIAILSALGIQRT